MFVDQNGVSCFIDQLGQTTWVDQNGVLLTCLAAGSAILSATGAAIVNFVSSAIMPTGSFNRSRIMGR
jgi:hypothetical protein